MFKKISILLILISVGAASVFIFNSVLAENIKQDIPLANEILPVDEGHYVTPLESLKDVDTVVYDVDTVYFNHGLVRQVLVPNIDYIIKNIFSEAKTFQFLANKDYEHKRSIHPNTIHISLAVRGRLYPNDKTLILSAISSKLTRGHDRQPLAHNDMPMPYLITGEDTIDEKDLERALKTLIGHLPNYIDCANEGTDSRNCKGKSYNLYKVEHVK